MVFEDIVDKHKWNKIINSFSEKDIYFDSGYFSPFEMWGDGVPHLIFFECEYGKVAYPFFLRDVSELPSLSFVDKDKYFDITSAYGYGGPLYKVNEGLNEENLKKAFFDQMTRFCNEKNIITQFDRFHPLLNNWKFFQGFSKIEYNKAK